MSGPKVSEDGRRQRECVSRKALVVQLASPRLHTLLHRIALGMSRCIIIQEIFDL